MAEERVGGARPVRVPRLWLLVPLLVAAWAALTAVLFVWPAHDQPGPADAIVVPGGDGARVPEALALVRAGDSKVLAVSVPGPGIYPCPRPIPGVRVVCFRPRPYSTQGEARWLADMARQQGWKRVLVVVSNTQATRGRIRIRRCYGGALRVVTVPVRRRLLLHGIVYESAAILKALVWQRSC